MGHVEAVEVVLEALGLLDRVEVAALDVLDQGGLDDLLVVEVDDADRHRGQPRRLGGPQPPLAGDELEALALLPHDQRLEDAVGLDALAQRRQLVVVEGLARLERVAVDGVQRHQRHLDGALLAGTA